MAKMVPGPLFPHSLPLAEATFYLLADLIHRKTGLYYDESKRELLADKLSPLLLERGLNDFLDYYYLLKYDLQADDEWDRVQAALAVNETYFWREVDQIQWVARALLPTLYRDRPQTSPRIWHAGCCSGEEPYSLVMASMEQGLPPGRLVVVGTDANKVALEAARQGRYGGRAFRSLPETLRDRYFTPVDARWQIADRVREAVSFRHQNLMDENSMATMRHFDVIFCRNVFIYFSREAIERVTRYFHQALEPGGYLLLGASESLLRYDTPFEYTEVDGILAWRKPPGATW